MPELAPLPLDEFWSIIEQVRERAGDLPEFNRLLADLLADWSLPRLAAFHKTMWFEIGVYHDQGDLMKLMSASAGYFRSDSNWDSYGGWLIAQGREFHTAVMRDPRTALTRIPSHEDLAQGASVIFAAQRACFNQTDDEYDLYDLFGTDLTGEPEPGVEFPITW